MSARQPSRSPSWPARLGWFALLWLGGVTAVGIVAYGLRLWLRA